MLEEDYLINYLKEDYRFSDKKVQDFITEFRSLTDIEKSDLIYEMIGKKIYREIPVDIDTFITSPDYLGPVYEGTIFPMWRQMLKEIYPAPFLKAYNEVILSCATRCFGKGTKVRMFDGSLKNVEDIVVGDVLMGPDGTERTVRHTMSGMDELYKIQPIGGKAFVCNSKHLVPLFNSSYSIDIEARVMASLPISSQFKLGYINPDYTTMSFKDYIAYSAGIGDYYGFTVDKDHKILLEDGLIQNNCGKSTLTTISFLYEMYLLMCMINPAKTLIGKANGSLVFAVLSVSNSLAMGTICADIQKGLSLSPYFQEQVPDDLPFSTVDKKGVPITSNILLKAGSTYATVVGTDLICGCLDEANIPTSRIAMSELVDTRLEMYKAMLDRRKATYDKAPRMTGIMWLTSSPTDEFDVIGERIRQVRTEGLQNVMIKDDIPRWEAREESMKNTFPLFLGSEFKDPCILDESDIALTSEEECNVIQVPEKYRTHFRNDITFAIRDIAGRRTSGEQSLFKSAAVFDRVFNKPNTIFSKDELRIDLDNMNDISDYLIDKDYFSHPRKPNCYRYIHLDIASKQDRFGMASVYSDMMEYVSAEGDRKYARKYYIDFVLGIVPMKGGTVDILRVLEFVYSLKDKGYPIKLVTTDSHQGELARQIIAKNGILTEYQSVEKEKDAYYNLKNLILTESLEGFKNVQLVSELRSLKDGPKKVEKRKGSTDDLSDSLAGACYSCFQDKFFKFNGDDVINMIDTLRGTTGFTGYNIFG